MGLLVGLDVAFTVTFTLPLALPREFSSKSYICDEETLNVVLPEPTALNLILVLNEDLPEPLAYNIIFPFEVFSPETY